MKKYFFTLTITLLIPFFVDFPQSQAGRRVCSELCQAELICKYDVDVYWEDKIAFDIAVLGGGNELVQLYCVYQVGLVVTVPDETVSVVDNENKIEVSNASPIPKKKVEPSESGNQKDTAEAIAKNNIALTNKSSSKTKVATLTE